MVRPAIAAFFTLVTTAPALFAEPFIMGKKSAVWNNPTGGPSTGAGTDWLHFGASDASSLRWWGTPPHFITTEGSPFSLGALYLTNGSSINPPTHTTFSVTLDIKKPIDEVPATFDFDVNLLSTNPNGGGDLKLSVIPGQTSTWTSANGTTYSLKLLGLSDTRKWNGETFAEITAGTDCDNNQTSAWIYGELSMEDPSVVHAPEPGAFVLAGIGLGLLALRRRLLNASRSATLTKCDA